MRAVFLGTPAAAVPSLAAAADICDIAAVVTQPDRPKGRGARPVPPPVKTAAEEWGFRVEQPVTPADLAHLITTLDVGVAIVVAYGVLLPPDLIYALDRGFVNLHFSLLPRWRGAAPVERAILAGDERTGVSMMLIEVELDTGPVIAVLETPISDDETGGSLTARMSYLAAEVIDDALPGYLAGDVRPAPQLAVGDTTARRLRRTEAQIDGSWSVDRAERAVRAFHPRPGAWLDLDGDLLKVSRAHIAALPSPVGVVEAHDGRPILGLEGGGLVLDEIQPAGKRTMHGVDWLNGRRGIGGTVTPRT